MLVLVLLVFMLISVHDHDFAFARGLAMLGANDDDRSWFSDRFAVNRTRAGANAEGSDGRDGP